MARPKGVAETRPRERKALSLGRRELALRIDRLQRIGVLAGTSRRVLEALGDSHYWLEVIGRLEDAMDYKTIAEVMKFHQQQRDGRPAQQINLTSFGVTVTADEIEKARAIVRELRGAQADAPAHIGTHTDVRTAEAFAVHSPSAPSAASIMLGEGEGAKKEG